MAALMNPGSTSTFLLRLSLFLLTAMVIASAQSPAKPAASANDDVPAASQIQPEELVQTIKSGALRNRWCCM
jgi:hypothetical protein